MIKLSKEQVIFLPFYNKTLKNNRKVMSRHRVVRKA